MQRFRMAWRSWGKSLLFSSVLGLFLIISLASARASTGVLAPESPTAPNAPQVLIFVDDPVHKPENSYVDIALRNLGIERYTAEYKDIKSFVDLVAGGNWDLIIFANDVTQPTKTVFDLLDAHVQKRGKLIIHTFAMEGFASHPLWQTLGVEFVETFIVGGGKDANPIFWWDADHPVFNDLEKVPPFLNLNNQTIVTWPVQQRVNFGKDTKPVAGYKEALEPGAGALVLGNYGTTVFKGWVDLIVGDDGDGDKTPDGIELWMNLIYQTLVNATLPPGSFSKSAPVNGTTGQSTNLNLTWGPSADATSYDYCIDTVNNAVCDTGWVGNGASRTVALTGLTSDMQYFWQARARNTSGTILANSGTWYNFRTALTIFNNFLPSVIMGGCSGFAGPLEAEANDTYALANGPICFGLEYIGSPDSHGSEQDDDWFKFTWPGSNSVTIDVTGFLADAQVLLYHESAPTSFVARDFSKVDGHYVVTYDGLAGQGVYYIRVFAPSGHPLGNGNYTLLVTTN